MMQQQQLLNLEKTCPYASLEKILPESGIRPTIMIKAILNHCNLN